MKEFSRIDFILQLRALTERFTHGHGDSKDMVDGGWRTPVLFSTPPFPWP